MPLSKNHSTVTAFCSRYAASCRKHTHKRERKRERKKERRRRERERESVCVVNALRILRAVRIEKRERERRFDGKLQREEKRR